MSGLLAKAGRFIWKYITARATGAFIEWALDYAILELVKKTDNKFDDEFVAKWIESKNEYKEENK